jgi:hypothetical protein
MTEDTKINKTKLVVIDTKTRVAVSYEGNFKCGEAHLPNPNDEEENFTAAEITDEMNTFREAADGAQYRAEAEVKRKADIGKRLVKATTEYAGWFDLFHPAEEIDTFGL